MSSNAGWWPDPAGSGWLRYFDGTKWTHHYGPSEPTRHPPAGWYPDPQGQPCQRYWDGQQWTSGVTAMQPEDAVRARADQQHRWVLNGDLRGIYGEAGAELMETITEEPREPLGESATVAQVAHTDAELTEMLKQQPPLWPATAFVSVMAQRREAVKARLRHVNLGSVDPRGRQISVPEAKVEIGGILIDLVRILGQTTDLIRSPGFQTMFGDSYDDAEADTILLGANRLMDYHDEFLRLAEQNRHLHVPLDLCRLQTVLGETLVDLLAAFDNLRDGIVKRLATMEEALRYGSFRVEDDPVLFSCGTGDELVQAIHDVYHEVD